jgi:hypothetical protein
MNSIDKSRRSVLKLLLAAPALLISGNIAMANNPIIQAPIPVEVSGVSDVPSLIRAIRNSAPGLVPSSTKDEVFHAELAKIFVRNAQAASEQGLHVPQWILERLPKRRVFFVIPIVLGVVILMINGVPFRMAVETVITAVLASIVLMTKSIVNVINSAAKTVVFI